MTLLETERLIRKISELLQQGGGAELASKLAGDFAATCHSANSRLQQCEAMIKAGDHHQAIQLAETTPNLLDLITVLEFRGTDDWRLYCQEKALPVADRIDARAVQSLNDCYGQGITTDHPLYAAYRKAVLSRNDEAALRALQSITRLNPSDGNAASELSRLDAKVLAGRLENLGGVLEGGDTTMVLAAMEAIEGFGFKTSLDGEVWRKAELVRCGNLLQQAAKQKAALEWGEALKNLEFVRRLQNQFQLELPRPAADLQKSLETWTREEQEKDRKNREFHGLLGELYYRIQQSEEKDTSARFVKLPELREDFEALHKLWRSLLDFTRPIPDDATAAFQKRAALLEAEIARRTGIRRRNVLVSSAVVLLLGATVTWLVLGRMKSRQVAESLQTAVSERQVRAAEHLLNGTRTGRKGLPSVGQLTALIASTESFVVKERSLLKTFEEAFSRLPTQLAGKHDPALVSSIASQWAAARGAFDALAPDLKTENEPRLRGFEKQWQQFLAESGAAANRLLEQWLSDAELQCAELDYRAPVTKAAAQLSTLAGIIQKVDELQSGFTNHVTLRSDLLQRATAARTKFIAYDRELKKLDDGMAALKKARAFDDFSAAIKLLASSEFSGAPASVAASSIQLLGISDEAILRSLLAATNPGTWAFLKKQKTTGLFPDVVMPAEESFFSRLYADPAVSANHHHYRLWLDPENTRSVEWITAGALENVQGWSQIKAWVFIPTASSARFEDREYGVFDGQWKISATERVYRLEQLEAPRTTEVFLELVQGKVWSGGGTYRKPALEVLDDIKNAKQGSPVFRAYLFHKLVEAMEFQPDSWGLTFCPSARAHAAEMTQITGGEISSGDWFVPAKTKNWSERLEQYFLAHKSLSYAKEATVNIALARAAATDGLKYVGFADLDGSLVFTENRAFSEIWGYDGTRSQPEIISKSALPLSPLFALSASRSEYLIKAGLSTNAVLNTDGLPPLFRPKTPK